MDLQKTWDENIDRSSQRSTVEDLAHTATVGVRSSKGMIVMLIAIPLAAAGLMFAAAPSADPVGTADTVYSATSMPLPLVGSWSLDASLMPEKERPPRVTMTFSSEEQTSELQSLMRISSDTFCLKK